MHPEIQRYISGVKREYPHYFKNSRVLEVGSLDINGSISGMFTNCVYTGVDLGLGPGVDVISPIHEYKSIHLSDVVVSAEMLEHDRHWEKSLQSMYDNLKSEGALILTCAGPNRQPHGTTHSHPTDAPFTNDWYRNVSIEDFSSILHPDMFILYHLEYSRGNTDVYFFGVKR